MNLKISATKPALAPRHLSPASKKRWKELVSEYGISDSAGLQILEEGLRAFDLAENARLTIETDGLTIRDKFNQLKSHPLLPTLRDSRAAYLNAMKMLKFDVSNSSEGSNK